MRSGHDRPESAVTLTGIRNGPKAVTVRPSGSQPLGDAILASNAAMQIAASLSAVPARMSALVAHADSGFPVGGCALGAGQ
jgi:hypothetical protein